MKSLLSRPALVAAAVLVVVALGVVFFVTRDSSSSTASESLGPASTTTTVAVTTTVPGEVTPDPSTETPTTTVPGEPAESGFELPEQPPLPLDVTVSPTTGLRDGDTVSVHVTPHAGSSIFGIEAFICQPGASYLLDADIRPSQTGKCITKKLSENSNDYVLVGVDPPYESADLSFRVGVGTDSYTTRQGNDVTITCGPGKPCQLVLKLQVPDSFGFQSYPLEFA